MEDTERSIWYHCPTVGKLYSDPQYACLQPFNTLFFLLFRTAVQKALKSLDPEGVERRRKRRLKRRQYYSKVYLIVTNH